MVGNDEQLWESVYPEVRTAYTLLDTDVPWRAVFDFTNIQPGDKLLVEVELELLGDPVPNLERSRTWVPNSRNEISYIQKDGYRVLVNNGVELGSSAVVSIEPDIGPWRSRMRYTQVGGIAKKVRYMVFK